MNLFQMKSAPVETGEIADTFVKERFIGIGYHNCGNLTGLTKEQIRERLKKTYGYTERELAYHLGSVNYFVNIMNKDDIVLIQENDWIHIGKISGDYRFDEFPNAAGLLHTRDVKWLKKTEKYYVNDYVKELLRNRSLITKFKYPVEIAELDRILEVDNDLEQEDKNKLVKKALDVLEKALECDDEEIKTKSAIEILRFLK